LKDAMLSVELKKELDIIGSNNMGLFYKHVASRSNHKTGIAPIKKCGWPINCRCKKES